MPEAILTDGEGNKLRAGIDVGGIITPDPLMDPERNQRIFDDFQNVKFRSDDIMLCTFPKSGTNWMYELLSMINNKSAERIASSKYDTMIELQPKEDMDKIPSPRVMDSHFRPSSLTLELSHKQCRVRATVREFRRPARTNKIAECQQQNSLLPKDFFRCKIKTILCLRNPKDVATSFYHHIVGISHYGYTGTFACWLPLYLEGNLEYGKYTDYLQDWERAIDAGLEFPLHIIYYEDLLLDTEKELNRLVKFLDIELSQTLKKDIIDACSFEKMAKEKLVASKDLCDKVFRKGFNFFRKGEIGDWKNLFTVTQHEMFEGIWNREMNDSNMFKSIYTDPVKFT